MAAGSDFRFSGLFRAYIVTIAIVMAFAAHGGVCFMRKKTLLRNSALTWFLVSLVPLLSVPGLTQDNQLIAPRVAAMDSKTFAKNLQARVQDFTKAKQELARAEAEFNSAQAEASVATPDCSRDQAALQYAKVLEADETRKAARRRLRNVGAALDGELGSANVALSNRENMQDIEEARTAEQKANKELREAKGRLAKARSSSAPGSSIGDLEAKVRNLEQKSVFVKNKLADLKGARGELKKSNNALSRVVATLTKAVRLRKIGKFSDTGIELLVAEVKTAATNHENSRTKLANLRTEVSSSVAELKSARSALPKKISSIAGAKATPGVSHPAPGQVYQYQTLPKAPGKISRTPTRRLLIPKP